MLVYQRVPSGNQTWLAGKSPNENGGFHGEIVELNLSGFPASHMRIPEDKYICFMVYGI